MSKFNELRTFISSLRLLIGWPVVFSSQQVYEILQTLSLERQYFKETEKVSSIHMSLIN